jgi:broad specificity phosphatase PhoE
MSDHLTQIDLLRHGETMNGARLRGSLDDPLTDEGWRQMEAAMVNAGPWDGIVSSPLSRCAAFAEALAFRLNLPVKIDERLREIHFGAWEGLSYAELMATAPTALMHFYQDPLRYPPPAAEPLEDFQERTLAALSEQFTPLNTSRRILFITHGGVIRVLLSYVRRWPLSRILEIDVPHASLHRLQGIDGCCEEVLEIRS